MKEPDHICLIRLHEVIDEADGDKLCMSKIINFISLKNSIGKSTLVFLYTFLFDSKEFERFISTNKVRMKN